MVEAQILTKGRIYMLFREFQIGVLEKAVLRDETLLQR